jgi:hypothetical protein
VKLARGLLIEQGSDESDTRLPTSPPAVARSVSGVTADARPNIYPDGLGEENVRPVAAWRRHASPFGLVVFAIVVTLALGGLFGRERTWSADASGVRLEVHTSEIIRNGEFFEMRVRVAGDEGIGELVIGVDDGIWEDVTVNTMIPAATEETNEDGETRFTFAELPAGTGFLLKVDMQINPDILGGNDGRVTIYDGDRELVSTPISIMVLP